ncbi:hypothetical protein PT287_07700 [Lactobacillus sp. ESL0679]|uniref:hypothetical protein n=1 Tax=Lactobacillus sp. ESL0679 TaxID=2983209 RepID=UPI0023F65D83|nr:hypothetical protein [Lactobacillus sp. ESL0679]MDF7683384.1 hypothetical protein [Lactobacillus sp. ESL0679]
MHNKKIKAYKAKDGKCYELVEVVKQGLEGYIYIVVTVDVGTHRGVDIATSVVEARKKLIEAGAVPVKLSDTVMEME